MIFVRKPTFPGRVKCDTRYQVILYFSFSLPELASFIANNIAMSNAVYSHDRLPFFITPANLYKTSSIPFLDVMGLLNTQNFSDNFGLNSLNAQWRVGEMLLRLLNAE